MMAFFCLALAACGGGGDTAEAPSLTLTATVSGLDEGENLTLVDESGNLQPTVVTSDGRISLGSVSAGSHYAVALKAGWYGDNLESGEYCYVRNGAGTVIVDGADIQIACGPAPAQIDLATDPKTAKKYGVSYLGWSLKYPAVVKGKLYYQVMYNGTPYNTVSTGRVSHDQNGYMLTDMTTLQMLFNGITIPRMGMRGDPATPQSAMASGSCSATCAANATALQTEGMGAIPVTLPTSVQLENLYLISRGADQPAGAPGVPPGWADSMFWSSTLDRSGVHYYMILRSGISSYLPISNFNYVAFQLP